MTSNNSLASKEYHLASAGFSNLPTHWKVVDVGEILSDDRGISVGVMYPGKHDPRGIPLVKAGDMNDHRINPTPEFRITPQKHREYKRTALEGGEILMTLVGAIGQCAIVPDEMIGWNAARAVAVIRLKDAKDAPFVRLCLLSRPLRHLMSVWANTTVQPTLNLKEIRQLPLPWPPKPEREAIAAVLSAFDDKIELNRQMNATLEEMARALFKSWFVDFDPVRRNQEARLFQKSLASAAPYDHLFPDELVVAENGRELPKGWKAGKLSDIAQNPRRSIQPEKTDPKTPYIGLQHMPQQSIALTDWGLANEVSSNKYEFKKGEFLFGKLRPYFHKVGVAPVDGVSSTDILTVIPKDEQWYGLVLGHISSAEFVEYTTAVSTGTRMPRTNWKDMSQFNIVIPSSDISQFYNSYSQPIIEQITNNIFESKTLANLRDTLLPKLITGEIRILQ